MKLRYFGVLAAAAFLAACESPSATSGGTEGGGTVRPVTDPNTIRQKDPREDFAAKAGDRVFFDFDKSSLRADAKATLDKQAAWLKAFPSYSMTIEGHADERGTREYNLALGEKRANSVAEYLKASGIAAARIKTVSYGKERPAAVGSTEAAWSQNRRGVTVLN